MAEWDQSRVQRLYEQAEQTAARAGETCRTARDLRSAAGNSERRTAGSRSGESDPRVLRPALDAPGMLEVSYPALPDSVPAARHAVARFAAAAGLSLERVEMVRLAVSEAVSNVVRHAYRGGAGEVGIVAAVTGGELWILVSDHGCGHQTPSLNPGLGLGLALMADACDEFELVQRGEGGTEARLRFYLPGAASTV